MPIQFKINQATGELCDVKIVRAPRDMRTYNRNYYEAKTKKVIQCEHCKALLCSQQNLTRHQEKSKKCQQIRSEKASAMDTSHVFFKAEVT